MIYLNVQLGINYDCMDGVAQFLQMIRNQLKLDAGVKTELKVSMILLKFFFVEKVQVNNCRSCRKQTYLVAYSFHSIDVSLMRKASLRLIAWDVHLVESFSLVLLSSLWSLSLPVRSLRILLLLQHILGRHPTKIIFL